MEEIEVVINFKFELKGRVWDDYLNTSVPEKREVDIDYLYKVDYRIIQGVLAEMYCKDYDAMSKQEQDAFDFAIECAYKQGLIGEYEVQTNEKLIEVLKNNSNIVELALEQAKYQYLDEDGYFIE